MTTVQKEKQLARELAEGLPEVDNERTFIVRVGGARGQNLHDIELPSGELMVCKMPAKFQKKVWIKRGDYVIATKLEGSEKLNLKVQAEITHVIHRDQLKELKQTPAWPAAFNKPVEDDDEVKVKETRTQARREAGSDEDSDEDNDDDLIPNRNRCVVDESEDGDSDEDEDDDDQ